MNKYAVFGLIVVVSVALDLWTKNLAENQLASSSRRWDHPIQRTVDGAPEQGMPLGEWIDAEFGEGTAEASPPLIHGVSLVDGPGSPTGMLPYTHVVENGAVVEIAYRQVVIVPGFWNHVYVQNFGAAWGFLSEQNEKFVRPFFLTVSVLAVLLVLGIFRNVRPDQKILMVALSLIVGGALGNFVDRARYGYVVDFIDWYATWGGEEHHWPTFNVADVWIAIGVGLMFIEILFTKDEDAKEDGDEEPAEAAA